VKILLTGSGGFIGGGLLARLVRDGHALTALYRTTPPAGCDDLPAGSVVTVRADLSRPLPDLGPHDAVIHAAAHTHLVPGSTVADYVAGNIQPALNLAAYAAKSGVSRFIFLSTLSVYGRVAEALLTEDAPIRDGEPYGVSKYLAEQALAEAAGPYGLVCLRMPGVVGRGYFTPWIGRVTRQAAAGQDIVIYNPASPFNNVLDLDEVHAGIGHLLSRPLSGAATVNLAASAPLPLAGVVRRIVSRLGSSSRLIEKPAERASFCIDTARCARLFGYVPASTSDIIDRYLSCNLDLLGVAA
jgi:nucleoside-diphosphate-sugar epimerase